VPSSDGRPVPLSSRAQDRVSRAEITESARPVRKVRWTSHRSVERGQEAFDDGLYPAPVFLRCGAAAGERLLDLLRERLLDGLLVLVQECALVPPELGVVVPPLDRYELAIDVSTSRPRYISRAPALRLMSVSTGFGL
jgi:hypothetical protein